MPRIAIAPHPQPNAFPTGRNECNAVVCVTEGRLQMLDREEVEGVLAHVCGANRDRSRFQSGKKLNLPTQIGVVSEHELAAFEQNAAKHRG